MVAHQSLRCSFAAAAAASARPSSAIRNVISGSIPASKRFLHARIKAPEIPSPIPFCPDHQTFLSLIGRDLSQHASKIEDWNTLFSLKSSQLKELGIEPPRSRRYLLRWLQKYRNGEFGIGGDLQHVKNGEAYVRLCGVPADSDVAKRAWVLIHGPESNGDGSQSAKPEDISATAVRSPGVRHVVLNIPVDTSSLESGIDEAEKPSTEASETAQESGETGEDGTAGTTVPPPPSMSTRLAKLLMRPLSTAEYAESVPVHGYKRHGTTSLSGPWTRPVKGTQGKVLRIKVTEGMWEHKRGHKVDGGERRKAEVRAKKRAAARKAGAR